MNKLSFSILASGLLICNAIAEEFSVFTLKDPQWIFDGGVRVINNDANKPTSHYLWLDSGKNIKVDFNRRAGHIYTKYVGAMPLLDANNRFSYTTNGNEISNFTVNAGDGGVFHLVKFGNRDGLKKANFNTDVAVIGKNSNFTLNLLNEKNSNINPTNIGAVKLGFGEKNIEDEESFMNISDSKSSFTLNSKKTIKVVQDHNYVGADKTYLNRGAKYTLTSDQDIVFLNAISNTYITYNKEYYNVKDNKFKRSPECLSKDINNKNDYDPNCHRIYSIGEDAIINLEATGKIRNGGYLFAKGGKGRLNITANTEFENLSGSAVDLILSDDGNTELYKSTLLPIDIKPNGNFEEAQGVVMARNGATVNIKAPDIFNRKDAAFINLGGDFKINGNLENSGWLIAGQGSPTSKFGYFDVTGKVTFNPDGKIALVLYSQEPLKGNQNILFLKADGGIEGFRDLKSDNIKLLRAKIVQDANTNLFKDSLTNVVSFNPALSGKDIFRVDITGDNKNLYYRLALTKKALDRSIDKIIAEQINEKKYREFLNKLNSENKDAIEILNVAKGTDKFGVTIVDEAIGASNGNQEAYKRLVKNINATSGAMSTFNEALDTMPVIKAMHFNTQMNIASRMVQFNKEPFAHVLPTEQTKLPSPKAYDVNPATNTDKVLTSSKGRRSLIVMSDVEENLANRVKNKEQVKETRVVKSYEERGNADNIDAPSSFWFNALNSKGDLQNSDLSLFGFSFGFDKRYDNHIAGIYASTASSKISFDKATAEAKNIQVGAYGRIFVEDVEIDLNGFYNFGANKIKRNFEFYSEPLAYDTKGDVHTFGIGTSVGYVFDIGNDYYIKPLVGLNAYMSKTPEYKEKGDLAFSKDSGTDKYVSMVIGTEFRKYFYNGNYFYIVPGVEQELSKSDNNMVKFSGYETAFSAKTNNKKQTYATLYGGTELKISDTFLFNLNLGTKMSKDEKYYNVNAGFKFTF